MLLFSSGAIRMGVDPKSAVGTIAVKQIRHLLLVWVYIFTCFTELKFRKAKKQACLISIGTRESLYTFTANYKRPRCVGGGSSKMWELV